MRKIYVTPAVGTKDASSKGPGFNRSRRWVQHGQGMTEYIVIVALIAVAAIGVYQFFGQVVRGQTAAIANEVGGVDGTASRKKATAAGTAASAETGKKGLDSFEGGQLSKGAGG